jgi:hypothetical protein
VKYCKSFSIEIFANVIIIICFFKSYALKKVVSLNCLIDWTE